MPRRFAEISFTDSVKAQQARYGSREMYHRFELAENSGDVLTEKEIEFIAARDSFYQATVAENGYPYMQFKGGATGFLKVLDHKTLAYGDVRGNRQYISLGNLAVNNRVSLILLDYPNRRRLKIWAQASVIEAEQNPALMLKLQTAGQIVERAIVMTLEAYDWNCPKNITPRFTEQEIQDIFLVPLQNRLSFLEHENQHLKTKLNLV